MLVAISKETSFEGEKNLFDNSRMAVFKMHVGSRLARGLTQYFYTAAVLSSRGGCPASGSV